MDSYRNQNGGCLMSDITVDYPVQGYNRVSKTGVRYSVKPHERKAKGKLQKEILQLKVEKIKAKQKRSYPGRLIKVTKSGKRYIEFASNELRGRGTAKAILVKGLWLPRSQTIIESKKGGVVYVAEWLFNEKQRELVLKEIETLNSYIQEEKESIREEERLINTDPSDPLVRFSSMTKEARENRIKKLNESIKKLEIRIQFQKKKLAFYTQDFILSPVVSTVDISKKLKGEEFIMSEDEWHMAHFGFVGQYPTYQEYLKKERKRLGLDFIQILTPVITSVIRRNDSIPFSEFKQIKTDFETKDFVIFHGPIARDGPYDYEDEKGNIITLYKDIDNLKDMYSRYNYLPMKTSEEVGAHYAEELGYGTNFSVNEETHEIEADLILVNDERFKDILSRKLEFHVSPGYNDIIKGNIQIITDLDHIALALGPEIGRACTGTNSKGVSCTKVKKLFHDQNLTEVVSN